jgi:hypothetical protein
VISVALLPLSVSAFASPFPSLDTLLVAPPVGFTEQNLGTLHGRFTAHDYAATYHERAVDAEHALGHDGFVDGYTVTWIQQSTGHFLIEWVIAFEGGKGARSWLAYEEASDRSEPTYQHSNFISGIGPYYGVHHADASTQVILDGFTFVKGNTMFGVGFASTRGDDVLALATAQVRNQYAAAPNQTIPQAQWPENANPRDFIDLARILVVVITLALTVGIGVLVVGRVRQSRLPRLSPDGNHWWDGEHWIDSMYVPPPFAERTSDGAYWWDGSIWRPVPAAQPPPSGQ